MAPSDQTRDTGEQAGKDQRSNRDDSSQRDKNEKLGPDDKTEGERVSDQMIREKEQELGTKTDLHPMGGGGRDGNIRIKDPPKELTKGMRLRGRAKIGE